MEIVTRKAEVKVYLEKCLYVYYTEGVEPLAHKIQDQLLRRKVKFPLLEYCSRELYNSLRSHDHLTLCDLIEASKTIGGNVLLGILLQCKLSDDFDLSMQYAVKYISQADAWYVCDIIGERVFGYSLLNSPSSTLTVIEKLSKHSSRWVVRALGAGIHYAIKKGLDKDYVKAVFPVLLSMANSKDKEIRQGMGWAAKTTAAYHPDIVDLYREEISNKGLVANWFRKKVDIGLKRNRYAQRNTG